MNTQIKNIFNEVLTLNRMNLQLITNNYNRKIWCLRLTLELDIQQRFLFLTFKLKRYF